ncbi:hypothetical protein MTP99_016398 [Tenebrio molitor]|nr:hypothetical protein MTP99_016398 [Tenebrio molitor]
MPESWVLGKSDSGWMKGDVFYEYIANDFNNWLIENSIKKPVILFIDGHRSHMTLPLSEFCEKSKIILYALPPNTTHMLQPADVSVFRPLKQGWKNTVRNWQSKPENINSSVTKTNFCRLFKETLEASDMTVAIKNGFRKCGLFPLNPDNVDYTKCVQNALERQSNQNQFIPPLDILTFEDYRSAEKVLKVIGPKLETYGINVNTIMNEIKFLENNRSEDNGQADDLLEIPMEIEDIIENVPNIPQVGSIISMDDVCIVPVIATHIKVKFDTVSLQNSDPESQSEVIEDLSFAPAPECSLITASTSELKSPSPKQCLELIETAAGCVNFPDTPQTHSENVDNSDKESKETNDLSLELQESNKTEHLSNDESQQPAQKIIVHSVEMLHKPTTDQSPLLKPIQPSDSFERHLSFPEPISKSKKTQPQKEKLPSAISSKAWRNFLSKKEEAKTAKLEGIRKRKQERQIAKEKRHTQIRRKKSENTANPKKPIGRPKRAKENVEAASSSSVSSRQKIHCASCDEELESDTEADEEKNIGCDICPRCGGKFIGTGEKIRLPDDVTMGYIIEHLLKKPLTVVDQFHSHLEPMKFIRREILEDQISFSYARNKDEWNVVKIEGFDTKYDTNRFLSLHCFLFPHFNFCPR